jgi:hypothetical protein
VPQTYDFITEDLLVSGFACLTAIPHSEILENTTLARPHPQPLSQAWERGARAAGSCGVRASQLRTPISQLLIDVSFPKAA